MSVLLMWILPVSWVPTSNTDFAMSLIFDRSWSETVQVMSLVLEALGLLLAWIEVLKPALARRITDVIYELAKLQLYADEDSTKISFSWKMFLFIEFITMGVIWLLVALNLSEILDYLREGGIYISLLHKIIFFPIALLGPIVVPIIFIKVLRSVTRFLSEISGGRPIGLMGIGLALCGMLGEIYQVVEMFLVNNG